MATAQPWAISESPRLEMEEAALEEYWSEERKAEAIPLLPTIEGSPPEDMALPEEAYGESAEEDSAMADGEVESESVEDETTEWGSSTFSTSKVGNLNVSPYAYVGKLFMTIGGKNYVGSAWCIYESSIFTAGHCVNSGGTSGGAAGTWASNVRFEGRYNNGSSVGSWACTRMVSLQGWTEDGNFQYDLAAAIATRPIRPTMGKMGWIANYPANQSPYTGIGYPAEPVAGYAFDGKYMWKSVGNYISGSSIIKVYNNMTGGCSGGPWRVPHNNKPGIANGINSHRYTSEPSTMRSPYFGQGFLNIVNWLKNNGGN